MKGRRQAELHLRSDPKFAEIIQSTQLRRRHHDGDVYTALLRTIVYQQLSGKAAKTIHARFLDLFESAYPHAQDVLELEMESLRAAGLSRQKSSYLKNVAGYWIDHDLDQVNWKTWADEEIVGELTNIKGVGVWSVQMLLMFTLNRPDVFPLGDLGIRNAIVKKYGLRSKGKRLDKRIFKVAERWRPHRTLASLYLWSWLDSQ